MLAALSQRTVSLDTAAPLTQQPYWHSIPTRHGSPTDTASPLDTASPQDTASPLTQQLHWQSSPTRHSIPTDTMLRAKRGAGCTPFVILHELLKVKVKLWVGHDGDERGPLMSTCTKSSIRICWGRWWMSGERIQTQWWWTRAFDEPLHTHTHTRTHTHTHTRTHTHTVVTNAGLFWAPAQINIWMALVVVNGERLYA